jgi:hypothetical protein
MTTSESSIGRGQILALAAFIVLLYTWVLLPDALVSDSFVLLLSKEDGLIEWLGALSLLVASGLFLLCFLRARRAGSNRVKQLFFIGLALALFIGAGEEISWGQRILGIETPEAVKEHNYQGELNLHNLSLPAWYGTAWHVFEIFTLLFMIALPITAWRNPQARAFLARYVPVVPLALGGLFLLAELMFLLTLLAYPDQWQSPDGVGNDVLRGEYRPTLGPWQGSGTSEAAFSLLWAVVAFDVLRSRGSPKSTP